MAATLHSCIVLMLAIGVLVAVPSFHFQEPIELGRFKSSAKDLMQALSKHNTYTRKYERAQKPLINSRKDSESVH
jgi:hypothetical protein